MDEPNTQDEAPVPALDLSGYRQVTVVRTDEIEGHVYRRGERCSVDAATLQAMRDKAMAESDAASA